MTPEPSSDPFAVPSGDRVGAAGQPSSVPPASAPPVPPTPAWATPPPAYPRQAPAEWTRSTAAVPRRRWGVPEYDEAQPYHRVLRTRNYRWWRPLVGLLVTAVTFVVISLVVTAAALLPAFFSGAIDLAEAEADPAAVLVSSPLGLLGVNLSLAAFIPAVILGLLAGHQLRPGWLHSVVGRMRWRFLLWCLLLEVAVTLVILPLSGIVGGDVASSSTPTEPLSFAAWLPFALVILFTTPLQAAGEEYGFRGYGLQALGAWVRHPWFAIVVTSLLFAAAHGSQNPALFGNRFAFGVIAAVLTLRTGGLEAAIGIHVVNNMVVLLIASAAGELAPSLTPTDAPWGVALLDVVGMLAYAAGALWLARRQGLTTSTAVSPPPVPAWPDEQPESPTPARWPDVPPAPGGFGQPPTPR